MGIKNVDDGMPSFEGGSGSVKNPLEGLSRGPTREAPTIALKEVVMHCRNCGNNHAYDMSPSVDVGLRIYKCQKCEKVFSINVGTVMK